jgi:hypothetical protein
MDRLALDDRTGRRRHIAHIERASALMQALIADLLDFSELQKGTLLLDTGGPELIN